MLKRLSFNWKGLFLWSNHFYGLCATLLAIESVEALFNKMPSIYVLAIIYLSTVVYYTYAYLNEPTDGIYNERGNWYAKNKKYLFLRQGLFTLAILYLAIFKLNVIGLFFAFPFWIKCLLLCSLVIAASYYSPLINSKLLRGIRTWGVMKSASIAWIWTVMCSLIPLLLSMKSETMSFLLTAHFLLYFSQLFIFILLLAILFDIKDLIRDKAEMVHTIVIKYGVDYTIQKLATPLVRAYFIISCIIYYLYHQSIIYLLAQLLLVITVYFVISVIQKAKSIHYNILFIDGLMIVKALVGIVYATYY